MDTIARTWLWMVFVISLVTALYFDFVELKNQGAHSFSVRRALKWSVVSVVLSLTTRITAARWPTKRASRSSPATSSRRA